MSNKLMDKIQEQAKQMAEREASQASYSGVRLPFWKPDDGEDNKIRILPAWTDEGYFADQFWREIGQHWNVSEDQKGPVICPNRTENKNDPCPICDFCDLLANDKNDISKKTLFKNIKAKKAYFVLVVDLNDPEYTAKEVAAFKGDECPFEVGDPKVQVYACPIGVWNGIISAINANKNDITDLKLGRNITVIKIPNKDRFKTKYTVAPDFEPSVAPVPEGFKTPDLEQVGWHMSHTELLDLLSGGKGGDYVALLPSGSAALPETTESDEVDGGYLAADDDGSSTAEEDLASQMKSALQ